MIQNKGLEIFVTDSLLLQNVSFIFAQKVLWI